MSLLEIRDLSVAFGKGCQEVRAIEQIGLTVDAGEILVAVGESGCGKSVTALAVMGLIDPRQGLITGGSVRVAGQELVGASPSALRSLRRGRLAMVFQEPLSALNPVMRVGEQIAEALPPETRDRPARAIALLTEVGIVDAATRARAYPHELSGGMRQRVVIAMALAQEPQVLIADEATTALDATVQAQILELFLALRRDRGLSILAITHDFGVVAEIADRVAVFYAGRVVETAPAARLFDAPAHPYTRALIAARLLPGLAPRTLLPEIAGVVPRLTDMPPGCRFAPRCPLATDLCRRTEPLPGQLAAGHVVACHHPVAAS
jgi:oligopeptide/dipeptide ABC transporter ATP-binding protein